MESRTRTPPTSNNLQHLTELLREQLKDCAEHARQLREEDNQRGSRYAKYENLWTALEKIKGEQDEKCRRAEDEKVRYTNPAGDFPDQKC